jgi:hypothetical protein
MSKCTPRLADDREGLRPIEGLPAMIHKALSGGISDIFGFALVVKVLAVQGALPTEDSALPDAVLRGSWPERP